MTQHSSCMRRLLGRMTYERAYAWICAIQNSMANYLCFEKLKILVYYIWDVLLFRSHFFLETFVHNINVRTALSFFIFIFNNN